MNKHSDFSLPMMSAVWLEPDNLSSPAPWAGHIPFAAWLMAVMRPQTVVELGVYSGISYLAFCQAAVEHQVDVRMWGVDTWQGDAHAGLYDGQTVLSTLRSRHDERYGHFSTLLQKTFDEALDDIADGSIDLLHIDGLHTYEAVRHDFETWLPKLSGRAVVLFHDTAVREGDFGVWRYWEELTREYPAIGFAHSNGLGVLLVGADAPQVLRDAAADGRRAAQWQTFFRTLGERFELRAERAHTATVLNDLDAKIRAQHEWIIQQDKMLLAKDAKERQTEQEIAGLHRSLDTQARHNEEKLADLHRSLQDLSRQFRDANRQLLAERSRAQGLDQEVHTLLHSRSWRITAPLRTASRMAHKLGTGALGGRMRTLLRRMGKVLGYVLTGNWRELMRRIRHVRGQAAQVSRLHQFDGLPDSLRAGILATPHTWYVAHALAGALGRAGIAVHMAEESADYPLDVYFVVCPQMFASLPDGEKRIAFQMEQSVSTRWFTRDYLATLENSLAVLDYARVNIANLAEYGIVFPHIYYAPIGGIADYGDASVQADEECDVLFYGDANAPRRKRMLEALGRHFKLRVVGNAFGADMHRALAGAKVVVNLHYYEGALLETTRVYECLSLGKSVVSEVSADQDEHDNLQGVVRFVPLDDEEALIAAVREALAEQEDDAARAAYAQRCAKVVAESQARFDFMIYRLLLARRMIDYATFAALTQSRQILAPRMALSLPEVVARREAFITVRPDDVAVFDGVRYTPGWLGAAMSFKYLAQCALQQGLPRLEILEDDVEFPQDYEVRRARVEAWLAAHEGQWDAFVGVMALVHPDTRVLAVERADGETFVTIDRMISMVGNIYAPAALSRIAAWDETDQDADTNTIDRYLQLSGGMRVVVTLPFLLGHREDLDSSLWGFSNVRYAQMIAKAQLELQKRVAEFERQGA